MQSEVKEVLRFGTSRNRPGRQPPWRVGSRTLPWSMNLLDQRDHAVAGLLVCWGSCPVLWHERAQFCVGFSVKR